MIKNLVIITILVASFLFIGPVSAVDTGSIVTHEKPVQISVVNKNLAIKSTKKPVTATSNSINNYTKNSTVVYNKNGLKNWYNDLNKLKLSKNKFLNINFIGDSITDGSNVGTTLYSYLHQSFVGLIRDNINSKFGNTGLGFMKPSYHDNHARYVITYTGWHGKTGDGMISQSETSIPGSIITIPFNGVGIRLYYHQGSSLTYGTFNATIDGIKQSTKTYNMGGVDDTGHFIDIAGLKDGYHTIKIVYTGTTSQMMCFQGFREITNAKYGIFVNRIARSGAATTRTDHFNSNTIKCSVDPFKPNLTIICLGMNDYLESRYSTFQSSFQAIITQAKLYGDCLIVIPGTPSQKRDIPWKNYTDVLYKLASQNNCGLIDLGERWGLNNHYMSVDGVHPIASGHQDMANAILDGIYGTKISDPYKDLTVTAINAPTMSFKGKNISLANTIKNLGNTATDSFFVNYYLKDIKNVMGQIYLGNTIINGLSAGCSYQLSTKLTIPSNIKAGDYYISAVVDSLHNITESNETNNIKYSNKIIIYNNSDLSVNYLNAPSTAFKGVNVKVSNTIINNGNDMVNGFYINFYLKSVKNNNKIYLGNRFVNQLSAKASNHQLSTIKIPSTINMGEYNIIAMVDSLNNITETNETNNIKYSNKINIKENIDLTISSIKITKNIDKGRNIQVSNTVYNKGDHAANGFWVNYYLKTSPKSSKLFIGSRYIVNLGPKAINYQQTNLNIPTNIASSNYYLYAYVDGYNSVTEVNEYNNYLYSSPIKLN